MIKWCNDRVMECGLSDLGFQGPKFTLKGPLLSGCSRLYERLDHALVNAQFLGNLGNCFVKVLPRTLFSDHNPLLLKFQADYTSRQSRLFKFEAMWLFHESFDEFLTNCWGGNGNLVVALHEFQSALLDWNRDCFGLIEKNKRILLARLSGIQNSPRYPHSNYLCHLERELQTELDQLLKTEEIKWFQKARTDWITKGDRNSRFYHLKGYNATKKEQNPNAKGCERVMGR